MKQINIPLLALGLSVCTGMDASAQIGKGVKFIGGRMAIDRSHSIVDQVPGTLEETKFNLVLNPNAGIYLSDAWAIGLGINYGYQWARNVSSYPPLSVKEVRATNNALGFSIFGRYAKPIGKKFFLLVDGSVSSGFGKLKVTEENTSGTGTTKATTEGTSKFGDNIAALIRPGVIFFVSPQFGLETSYGSLGYVHNKVGNAKSSQLGLDLGISSLSFGANYYFRCKPKPRPVAEAEE